MINGVTISYTFNILKTYKIYIKYKNQCLTYKIPFLFKQLSSQKLIHFFERTHSAKRAAPYPVAPPF